MHREVVLGNPTGLGAQLAGSYIREEYLEKIPDRVLSVWQSCSMNSRCI